MLSTTASNFCWFFGTAVTFGFGVFGPFLVDTVGGFCPSSPGSVFEGPRTATGGGAVLMMRLREETLQCHSSVYN